MSLFTLETDRLVIKEYKIEDLMDIHRYASDQEVTKYMIWGPNTLEDTKDFLNYTLSFQDKNPRMVYELAVWLKNEPILIGGCGLHLRSTTHKEAEFGYCLAKEHWGKGYATEAASAILDFGFKQLHMHRIIATCDPNNIGSYKVMEKLGMKREGYLRENLYVRDRWRDSYLYSILDHEWKKEKKDAKN